MSVEEASVAKVVQTAFATRSGPRVSESSEHWEAVMSDDAALYVQDRAVRTTPWDEAVFGRTFRREIATVNGEVRIHYVIGGEGPSLVLLHGFPQTWREWRLVMPALAEACYTVVAPDLRGFGDSDKLLEGYDGLTVGEDIRQLVK